MVLVEEVQHFHEDYDSSLPNVNFTHPPVWIRNMDQIQIGSKQARGVPNAMPASNSWESHCTVKFSIKLTVSTATTHQPTTQPCLLNECGLATASAPLVTMIHLLENTTYCTQENKDKTNRGGPEGSTSYSQLSLPVSTWASKSWKKMGNKRHPQQRIGCEVDLLH